MNGVPGSQPLDPRSLPQDSKSRSKDSQLYKQDAVSRSQEPMSKLHDPRLGSQDPRSFSQETRSQDPRSQRSLPATQHSNQSNAIPSVYKLSDLQRQHGEGQPTSGTQYAMSPGYRHHSQPQNAPTSSHHGNRQTDYNYPSEKAFKPIENPKTQYQSRNLEGRTFQPISVSEQSSHNPYQSAVKPRTDEHSYARLGNHGQPRTDKPMSYINLQPQTQNTRFRAATDYQSSGGAAAADDDDDGGFRSRARAQSSSTVV